MRKLLAYVLVCSAVPFEALACHPETGERIQWAYFSWGAEGLSHQTRVGEAFSYTRLPSGHRLALRVSPATEAVYHEQFQWRAHNVELVYVEIYDASTQPYQLLYKSLAGANSSSELPSIALPQDVVEQLRLNLSKPVCVSAKDAVAAGEAG